MSRLGSKLQALADGLAAYAPGRTVTRSFQPFDQRPHAELAAGVWTLLSRRGAEFDSPPNRLAQTGRIEPLLIGQFVLAESATGVQVEEQELLLLDEIIDFLGTHPAGLCGVDITGFQQSRQMEHPFGWIAIELLWTEYD